MRRLEFTIDEQSGEVRAFLGGLPGYACDGLTRELECLLGRATDRDADLPLAYAAALMAEQAGAELFSEGLAEFVWGREAEDE